MPKIRRWFPVSHDINRDTEMWEFRKLIGRRADAIWLEILSIADRNEGRLPGQWKDYPALLAGVCKSKRITTEHACCWLRRWIEVNQNGNARVRNFADYHRTRVPNKSLSEPSEPSDPNKSKATPPLKDEKPKKNGQTQTLFKLAQELSGGDRQRAKELCAFVGKTVKEGIKFGDSDEVINDGIIYTLEALKTRAQKEGQPIGEGLLWPYLQKTYQFKRTRALETEAQRYKREPLQSAGSVLRAVMRSAS